MPVEKGTNSMLWQMGLYKEEETDLKNNLQRSCYNWAHVLVKILYESLLPPNVAWFVSLLTHAGFSLCLKNELFRCGVSLGRGECGFRLGPHAGAEELLALFFPGPLCCALRESSATRSFLSSAGLNSVMKWGCVVKVLCRDTCSDCFWKLMCCCCHIGAVLYALPFR